MKVVDGIPQGHHKGKRSSIKESGGLIGWRGLIPNLRELGILSHYHINKITLSKPLSHLNHIITTNILLDFAIEKWLVRIFISLPSVVAKISPKDSRSSKCLVKEVLVRAKAPRGVWDSSLIAWRLPILNLWRVCRRWSSSLPALLVGLGMASITQFFWLITFFEISKYQFAMNSQSIPAWRSLVKGFLEWPTFLNSSKL